MALTQAQLVTLKADILADPILNAHPMNPDGAFAIALAYSVIVTPDYWVWRTSVEKKEIVSQASQDGTTFTWAGSGFITRSVGEQTCWEQLFNSTQTCNPSLPNVRQAFQDIFSGAGNAASNRTHLLVVGRRKANRVEKLFATGLGTTGSPSTMGFEGNLAYQDVENARSLP